MKNKRLTLESFKSVVKRMIKEATVNDLFPMDDDVRKAFFTKDMETMGNEKIQQLLDYVNEYHISGRNNQAIPGAFNR
jgi:DNA-directed RNA polymerase subunit F